MGFINIGWRKPGPSHSAQSRGHARPLRRRFKQLLVLAIVLVVAYHLWIIGCILWWKFSPPSSTAFMRAQLSLLRQQNPQAKLNYQWVDYRAISRPLKMAIVAAEDAKFMEHYGFDWTGLQNAYAKNRKRGRIVAGGSTISQQLAKNLFLSSERSVLRKAQEAEITLLLELLLSKERILELYLNVIEWGSGIFGAQAAAQVYFQQSAAHLGANQSAQLAAMVTRPRFYQKALQHPSLKRKKAILLQRMSASRIP